MKRIAARRATLTLLALVAGLSAGPAKGEPAGETLRVATRALAVPTVVQPAPWRVVAATSLTSAHPDFGGFSGLSVGPDCRAVAISDAGHWLSFTLKPGRGERPARIEAARIGPVAGLDGAALAPKRLADAEALARVSDGGLLVGFERAHRLWRYARPFARPTPLPAPPGLDGLPANRGIEAAAVLPDGRVLILAEGGATAGALPGWIGEGADWRRLAYPFDGDFRPTALSVGPGGQPYVLERAFSRWRGVRLRLQSLRLDGDTVALGEVLRIAAPIPADNGEALSWVPGGPDGQGTFFVLSDDNFSGLQRTILWRIAPAGRAEGLTPCG